VAARLSFFTMIVGCSIPIHLNKIIIKEPHGSLAADTISECLPNSKIIILLRDGRDVLDSEVDGFLKENITAKTEQLFYKNDKTDFRKRKVGLGNYLV